MSRTFFKAKKFLASKFSESQTGRTVLLRLFGQNGDRIMQAMKDAAEQCELVVGGRWSRRTKNDALHDDGDEADGAKVYGDAHRPPSPHAR